MANQAKEPYVTRTRMARLVPHMQHVARILASPLKGVYSTHIDSAQQFDRHWHDTYGFGFLEHGAQEWFSGRGIVRGYPGEVISARPRGAGASSMSTWT